MTNFALQALAAGGQGANLAADTLIKQLEAQARKKAIDQQDKADQAQDIWGKAIADMLAGGSSTPATLPIAPQPGQPSVAMTQQPGATPGTPGMMTPGSAGPGMGGPPSPARQLLQGGGPPAGSPAQAVLQGQQPQMPQAPSFMGGQFDPQALLADIRAKNPNLPPGTLGMIVEQHLLPMMNAQQQAEFKQVKFQLDMLKADNEQKDKIYDLIFKYKKLDQAANDAELNRDLRERLAEGADQTKLMIATMLQSIRQQNADTNARRADAYAKNVDSEVSARAERGQGKTVTPVTPVTPATVERWRVENAKIDEAKAYVAQNLAKLPAAQKQQFPSGEQKYLLDQWRLSQKPKYEIPGTTAAGGATGSAQPAAGVGQPSPSAAPKGSGATETDPLVLSPEDIQQVLDKKVFQDIVSSGRSRFIKWKTAGGQERTIYVDKTSAQNALAQAAAGGGGGVTP